MAEPKVSWSLAKIFYWRNLGDDIHNVQFSTKTLTYGQAIGPALFIPHHSIVPLLTTHCPLLTDARSVTGFGLGRATHSC